MATKITKLQSALVDVEAKAHYSGSLIAALGNPSEYEYTGNCIDAGAPTAKCACGHPIRYCFQIQHKQTKQLQIVGSTCIDHFAHIAPELYTALINAAQALQNQIANAKQQSKTAKDAAEVAELKKQWDEKLAQAREYIKSKSRTETRYNYHGSYALSGRLPYNLWITWTKKTPKEDPEYSRPSDYKRWYKKQIDHLDRLMQIRD